MEHPKCVDCKYWGLVHEDWDLPPGFRTCNLAPMSCEITDWDHSTLTNVIKPEYADLKFSVMDGSSYTANLHTRGDFYCAMHEAR